MAQRGLSAAWSSNLFPSNSIEEAASHAPKIDPKDLLSVFFDIAKSVAVGFHSHGVPLVEGAHNFGHADEEWVYRFINDDGPGVTAWNPESGRRWRLEWQEVELTPGGAYEAGNQ